MSEWRSSCVMRGDKVLVLGEVGIGIFDGYLMGSEGDKVCIKGEGGTFWTYRKRVAQLPAPRGGWTR